MTLPKGGATELASMKLPPLREIRILYHMGSQWHSVTPGRAENPALVPSRSRYSIQRSRRDGSWKTELIFVMWKRTGWIWTRDLSIASPTPYRSANTLCRTDKIGYMKSNVSVHTRVVALRHRAACCVVNAAYRNTSQRNACNKRKWIYVSRSYAHRLELWFFRWRILNKVKIIGLVIVYSIHFRHL